MLLNTANFDPAFVHAPPLSSHPIATSYQTCNKSLSQSDQFPLTTVQHSKESTPLVDVVVGRVSAPRIVGEYTRSQNSNDLHKLHLPFITRPGVPNASWLMRYSEDGACGLVSRHFGVKAPWRLPSHLTDGFCFCFLTRSDRHTKRRLLNAMIIVATTIATSLVYIIFLLPY